MASCFIPSFIKRTNPFSSVDLRVPPFALGSTWRASRECPRWTSALRCLQPSLRALRIAMVANYWHIQYHEGQTNGGNLLGSSVGREGVAIQAWWKYRFSPANFLEFSAKLNRVDAAFIPQGGHWQDYSARHEIHFSSGFYLKSLLQLEHISHYPVLFSTAVNNVTASLELGVIPSHRAP